MSNAVEKITEEIKRNGPIPFVRFMELALYCPDCGFYEKEKDRIGRAGDFFTSVSVGTLFGELLAYKFSEWFTSQRMNASLRIVEAGAHDGRLAGDILRWLRDHRTDIFYQLEYCFVEKSPHRREWQQKTLGDFRSNLHWLPEISALKALPSAYTIIFSNEFLDAMPFRRLWWDAQAKKWFEWAVALESDRFVWVRPRNQVSRFTFHVPDLHKMFDLLPDGFTTEINPASEAWWRDAAGSLESGKLLAIDYGLNASEFFLPERSGGTARAYYRHHAGQDLLAHPGEQDITAHVNFTAIQNAGEAAGLKTEAFVYQMQFLTRIAEETWNRAGVFGEWNSKRTRQFQTLTHPEHLGRPFWVLVQAR